MLYIEDYLELIEPFPQELRERLTEMREIDLKIQNETDKLDERIDSFFQQCKKQKPEWKNENSEEIKKEYMKLLENADDKIQIASQLYDLLEKYIKKLDQELHKFKLELEADHAGITSKLEQEISSKTLNEHVSLNKINSYSSLSLTFNNLNNHTTDESDFTLCPSSSNDLMQMMLNSQTSYNIGENLSNHKRKHSNFSEKSSNLINGNLFGRDDEDSSSSWNSSNQNNSVINFNRKSSVNASGINKRTLSTSSRQASTLESGLLNLINSTAINKRLNSSSKNKKIKSDKNRIKKSRPNELDYDDEAFDEDENARNDFYQTDDETNEGSNETPSEVTSSENGVNTIQDDEDLETDDDDDRVSEDLDHKFKIPTSKNTRNQYSNNHRQFKDEWNSGEDTNERYCICKDISYGDMIMCDNSLCETQWFHFVCVGLTSAPKGKWYCPKCLIEIKKKRREKTMLTSNLNQSLNININSLLNTTTNPSTSSSLTPSSLANQNDILTFSNP